MIVDWIRNSALTPALIVALNDLHQFDLVTLKWSQISSYVASPAALSFRSGFGFAAAGQSLFVFGGLSRSAGANFFTNFNQSSTENSVENL